MRSQLKLLLKLVIKVFMIDEFLKNSNSNRLTKTTRKN